MSYLPSASASRCGSGSSALTARSAPLELPNVHVLAVVSSAPVSNRGILRALANICRAAVILASLYGLAWVRGAPPLWGYFVVPPLSVLALYLALGSDWRVRWLAFYILAIAAFAHLRTLADETGVFIHVAYPIEADRMLFMGVTPTEWLQERLYNPASVSALDYLVTFVYMSYFPAMPLVAFALVVWAPRYFPRFSVAMVATLWTGLVIYFLVPTTPPWMASEQGAIGEVARIVQVTTGAVSESAYSSGERVVGTNEVAAMPSLHMAISVLVALTLGRVHPRLRLIVFVYPLAMAFTLMYAAEHYFVDAAAGTVLAFSAWWLAPRFTARAQGSPGLQPLEAAERPGHEPIQVDVLRRAA